MPNLKLQVGRSLAVIPSPNTNIPMPNVIVTSTATTTTANKLVDSTKNFTSLGTNPLNVQVGDIVYNTTTSTAATVTNVDSATQLSLNANIMTATNAYTLYSGTNTAGSTEPCVLYIGTSGNIKVVTAGGDEVTFVGVSGFFPVQVIRVLSAGTTATNIVALWQMIQIGINIAVKGSSSLVINIVNTFEARVLGLGGVFEAKVCLIAQLTALNNIQ